jgi:hypothetical protein
MDAEANYHRRTIKAAPMLLWALRRLGRSSTPLIFLAAFGVLAFIFSATVPDDDDIQQECLQSSKSKQCFLVNHKTATDFPTPRIYAGGSVHASLTPQLASYHQTGLLGLARDHVKDRVCACRMGDRSPPTQPS